jgi:hypothetical protein
MTIELDFKILSVLDYTKELIKCYAQDKDGTIFGGFAIYANEARFYTKNLNTEDKLTILRFVELITNCNNPEYKSIISSTLRDLTKINELLKEN